MSNVILAISMSLDGYVTGPDVTETDPLGKGGERLHAWSSDRDGQALMTRAGKTLGAVICGRRTYDMSLPGWGTNGPTGGRRVPVFVLTHHPTENTDVYHFTSTIESTLAAARASAAGGDVTVMGGADTARQFLTHNLVDEIQIHLVPVLFGAGTLLFENLDLDLTPVEVIDSPAATHLRYRVSRFAGPSR